MLKQFSMPTTDHGFAPRGASNSDWSRALIAMQQAVGEAGEDLDSVMRIVADAAVAMIPAAAGAIVEMRDGDALANRATSGSCWAALNLRLDIASSLSGECVIEGRPLICEDTEADQRVDRGACRRFGIRSIIVVPLPHRGEVVGVLKIVAAEANAFSEADFLTAQLLAGPLAIGLASAEEADANAARRLAEKRFAATFEQAAVGIAHVAPDGRFLLVNDRFCEVTGYSRQQITGRTFQEITHPEDLESDLELVRALVEHRLPRYSIEKRYLGQEGEAIWINLTVSLVRDERDEPSFFVAVIEDISARKRAEKAALHDPLTGLLNRRGVSEKLERELARSGFGKQPLTIAYLDLDGFKEVNDRLGHPEGDRCLRAIADALVHVSRPADVIGRLGGDEFLIILPDMSAEDADKLARRLGDGVQACAAERQWGVTASIGLLCLESGSLSDAETIITECDALMYRAKQQGKNRHVVEIRA